MRMGDGHGSEKNAHAGVQELKAKRDMLKRMSAPVRKGEAQMAPSDCICVSGRDEARAVVIDYSECFYNPYRRHSTLGHESPIAFVGKMRVACPSTKPGQPTLPGTGRPCG